MSHPGTRVVGVGDMAHSTDPSQTLVTYALGSCLGVLAWDAKSKVGGLLHYMLPFSSINPQKAAEREAMFGDLALPRFMEGLFALGATRRELVVKIAGGSEMYGADRFEIGRRNILLARKILWKNGILPAAEAVGGRASRTLRLHVGSGLATIKDPAGEREF